MNAQRILMAPAPSRKKS